MISYMISIFMDNIYPISRILLKNWNPSHAHCRGPILRSPVHDSDGATDGKSGISDGRGIRDVHRIGTRAAKLFIVTLFWRGSPHPCQEYQLARARNWLWTRTIVPIDRGKARRNVSIWQKYSRNVLRRASYETALDLWQICHKSDRVLSWSHFAI